MGPDLPLATVLMSFQSLSWFILRHRGSPWSLPGMVGWSQRRLLVRLPAACRWRGPFWPTGRVALTCCSLMWGLLCQVWCDLPKTHHGRIPLPCAPSLLVSPGMRRGVSGQWEREEERVSSMFIDPLVSGVGFAWWW